MKNMQPSDKRVRLVKWEHLPNGSTVATYASSRGTARIIKEPGEKGWRVVGDGAQRHKKAAAIAYVTAVLTDTGPLQPWVQAPAASDPPQEP